MSTKKAKANNNRQLAVVRPTRKIGAQQKRPVFVGTKLVGYGDYTEAKGRKLYDKRKNKKKTKKNNKSKNGWWETLSNVGNVAAPMLGKMAMGALTGFGDYTVDTNTVAAEATGGAIGGQIPIISNSHCANIMRHREYVGPVNGSTLPFTIANSIPLNPGLPSSFPWLAPIASCYTRYRWRGVIVEYVPLSCDFSSSGSLGFVALATQYNPLDAAFTDKRQMLNHEFSTEIKPSKVGVHPIECAKNQLSIDEYFVRSGPISSGSDIRFYDTGTVTVATGGNAVNTQVGDLWITYEIEFYQPKLSLVSNSSSIYFVFTSVPNIGAGTWFNTTTAPLIRGNMTGYQLTGNKFSFPLSTSSGYFLLQYSVTGVAVVTAGITAGTFGGLNINIIDTNYATLGLSSTSFVITVLLQVTASAASFSFVGTATLPVSISTDLTITRFDDFDKFITLSTPQSSALTVYGDSKSEDSSDDEDRIDGLEDQIRALTRMTLELMKKLDGSSNSNFSSPM